MEERSLKPLWIGIALMLAGVGLMYWSFSFNGLDGDEEVVNSDKKIINEDEGGEICLQVITPAKNPDTGEIVDYPTPCDVPEGWEVVQE